MKEKAQTNEQTEPNEHPDWENKLTDKKSRQKESNKH
jgi:hypothetical protein